MIAGHSGVFAEHWRCALVQNYMMNQILVALLYEWCISYHVMFLVQGGLEDLAPVDSIRGIGYFKLLDRNIIKPQFIH